MIEISQLAPIELLSSPWSSAFSQFVESVHDDLLIASPFLGAMPLRVIRANMTARQQPSTTRIHLLTNLAAESLLGGSLDITALLELASSVPHVTITYLPSLHAKVYIADTETAIVTSANLTYGGLISNHEYGVVLRHPPLVHQVRADFTKYAALGNQVTQEGLQTIAQTTEELRATQRKIDTSANTKLKAVLKEQIEQTKQELLEIRAQGKTTNGIFCDSILYLLERHGPLTTENLHPLIQQIHPDLCDDKEDRVIKDVHFGKKWKHHVRNAQQALVRRGLIRLDGKRWSCIV